MSAIKFLSQILMAGILISSHLLCLQWSPAGETEQLLLMVQFNSAWFLFYNGLKLNLNSDTCTWLLSIIKSWQDSGSSEWRLFAMLPQKIKPNWKTAPWNSTFLKCNREILSNYKELASLFYLSRPFSFFFFLNKAWFSSANCYIILTRWLCFEEG